MGDPIEIHHLRVALERKTWANVNMMDLERLLQVYDIMIEALTRIEAETGEHEVAAIASAALMDCID